MYREQFSDRRLDGPGQHSQMTVDAVKEHTLPGIGSCLQPLPELPDLPKRVNDFPDKCQPEHIQCFNRLLAHSQ